MVPPVRVQVTRYDIEPKDLLRKYRKEKNTSFRDRIHAVGLIANGYTVEETAAIMLISERSIRWWVSLYNSGGLEELHPKKNPDALQD